MINCIAVDDEPPALALIQRFASKTPELNLQATFSNPVAARDYIQGNPVELLLLDIRMHDINGIDLLKSLPVQPLVIFTTAYKRYAVEGFELNAIDYLLKPFGQARFQRAITKAVEISKLRRNDTPAAGEYLYIPVDYKIKKVRLKEILYLESQDNYVKIHMAHTSYLVLTPLSVIAEKLPAGEFVRIHRRYIVAWDKLVFIQFRKVGLPNGIRLPVGDTFRPKIARLGLHKHG